MAEQILNWQQCRWDTSIYMNVSQYTDLGLNRFHYSECEILRSRDTLRISLISKHCEESLSETCYPKNVDNLEDTRKTFEHSKNLTKTTKTKKSSGETYENLMENR